MRAGGDWSHVTDALAVIQSLYDEGRFRSMLTACRRARSLLPSASAQEAAEILRQEGVALHCMRRYDDALAAYAEARSADPLDEELDALLRLNVVMVLRDQGRVDAAVAELKLLQKSDSTPAHLLACVLQTLGSALEDNDPLAAAAAYREAREVGDATEAAIAGFSLGNVLRRIDELPAAAVAYNAALQTYALLDDRSRIADCLDSLGMVKAYENDYAAALELHDRATALYETLERPHDLVIALQNRAWALLRLEHPEQSLAVYQDAAAILRAVGTPAEAAFADLQTVPALCALGRTDEAALLLDGLDRRHLDTTEQAGAAWMTGWVACHTGDEKRCREARTYAAEVFSDAHEYASAREVRELPHPL